MNWARMLAYITGTVDQELLLRNEYLAAENRILRAQIKGRLLLSDAEKATLAVLPPSNVVKRPKAWHSQPTVHLRHSETRLRSCRLKQRRFPNRRSPVTSFALRSILPAWRVSEPSVRISTPGVDGQNCTNRQRKTHISETRAVLYPWHPGVAELYWWSASKATGKRSFIAMSRRRRVRVF